MVLAIWLILGFILSVTPLIDVEDTNKYGILCTSVLWPYFLYKHNG
jgi:hypothetical protein